MEHELLKVLNYSLDFALSKKYLKLIKRRLEP